MFECIHCHQTFSGSASDWIGQYPLCFKCTEELEKARTMENERTYVGEKLDMPERPTLLRTKLSHDYLRGFRDGVLETCK
jgi:hypothetical protein